MGVALTQAAEDSAQWLPGVERIEERLKKTPQQRVADGGYTTRDTIEKMAQRGIDFLGSMEKRTSGATAPSAFRRVRSSIQQRRIGMFARKASCFGPQDD